MRRLTEWGRGSDKGWDEAGKEMFGGETGGRREERTGRKRAARSLEECERGGERGQLRKASSCAPSTLILSGLFAWGTHSASTPSLSPPISCSYPLCPRYTSNEQKKPFGALDVTCFVQRHTNCSVEMHVKSARTDTHGHSDVPGAKIPDRKDKHLGTYTPFTHVCLPNRGGSRDRQSRCENRGFKSSDVMRPNEISWSANELTDSIKVCHENKSMRHPVPGEMSLYPDICLLTKPPKNFCFRKVPNVAQKSRLCYWKTIKTGMCYGGFCVNYSSEALQGTGAGTVKIRQENSF